MLFIIFGKGTVGGRRSKVGFVAIPFASVYIVCVKYDCKNTSVQICGIVESQLVDGNLHWEGVIEDGYCMFLLARLHRVCWDLDFLAQRSLVLHSY